MSRKVFSGAQPTGGMHIGGYLGAFRNWVALQDDFDQCYYCVVDLHAITVEIDPKELVANRQEAARLFLAMGVDPERSLLYHQSDVPQHAELAWVLGTLASLGALNRMTQFKEKSDKHGAALGLLAYPVLQAADILIHRVHAVPVGEDQKQHLELTRDIAQRYNSRFGELFPLPEPVIPDVGARIMSLADPANKMSKSDESENSRVELLDEDDAIRKKFSRAVTDSETEVRYDWDAKPGVSNLLEILSLFSGRPVAEWEAELSGGGYAGLKEAAAEATIAGLAPIKERYESLTDAEVTEVLRDSAERARVSAQETIEAVYGAIGLGD